MQAKPEANHFTCFQIKKKKKKGNILLNTIYRDAEVRLRAKNIFIIDVNMKPQWWYKFLKNVGLAV